MLHLRKTLSNDKNTTQKSALKSEKSLENVLQLHQIRKETNQTIEHSKQAPVTATSLGNHSFTGA